MQSEETKNKKRENILFSLGGFGTNNLLYNNYIDDEISKKIEKIKVNLINEIREEIKKEIKKEIESQFEGLKAELKNEIRINYNDLYEKIREREDEWEKITDNKMPDK